MPDFSPEQRRLLYLNGDTLTVEDVVAVATSQVKVQLTGSARMRMLASRQVVEKSLLANEAVYGLTTDLGPLKNVRISESEMDDFQINMVILHAYPVGEELDAASVRAMMLSRVNTLCKGGTGGRPEVADTIVELLNRGVHPLVFSGNSVGEADLSEMAQIAQVLLGYGEAEFEGVRLPGVEALARAGIEPLKLAAREALALFSNNGLTLGVGSLVVASARRLVEALDISAALAMEAFLANLSVLHPAASRLKAHPGLVAASQRIAGLLNGSHLWHPQAARNLQDPLSFRCIPQVHGALHEALSELQRSLEIELNSVGDNPLTDIIEQTIVHVGNFDVTTLAIKFDTLRIALAHAVNLANERIQKQMWTGFSALPSGLQKPGQALTRLIPLSRSAAALAAKAQALAMPASLLCRGEIAEGIEDHSSAAPLSIEQTRQMIDVVARIACIEMLVASAAIEMREHVKLGSGTSRVYQLIMSSGAVDAGSWKAHSERLNAAIKSGALAQVALSRKPNRMARSKNSAPVSPHHPSSPHHPPSQAAGTLASASG